MKTIPLILLRLRTAIFVNLDISPAELVYSTNLRLPYHFLQTSQPNITSDPRNFADLHFQPTFCMQFLACPLALPKSILQRNNQLRFKIPFHPESNLSGGVVWQIKITYQNSFKLVNLSSLFNQVIIIVNFCL